MSRTEIDDTEIENIGAACMTYLIANPEELSRFMNYAGIDSDTLRQTIGSRELANGMMDYFAQNESALLAMCANANISADAFMRLWQRQNPDR